MGAQAHKARLDDDDEGPRRTKRDEPEYDEDVRGSLLV